MYNSTLKESVQWGKRGTSIGITSDGIGKGKTNTATALKKTGWESSSIFAYIQTMRNNKVGDCDDWFIASKAEQDKLKASGLVDWYSNYYIWSSVESEADYAYYWRNDNNFWIDEFKQFAKPYCFGARAF